MFKLPEHKVVILPHLWPLAFDIKPKVTGFS